MIDPEMAFQQLIMADPRFDAMHASIFTQDLPENIEYPAICVWCIQDQPGQTLDGSDGTVDQNWRFDCYSKDYDEVKTLRRIVKDALIFDGEDLSNGGKKVVLDGQGTLVILSSTWRGGSSVSFVENSLEIRGWEIEIEFGLWEDVL